LDYTVGVKDELNKFLISVFEQSPIDLAAFGQEYFSKINSEKQKKLLKPLIISGPSGVGKGTIINWLIKNNPNLFGLSVSATTR